MGTKMELLDLARHLKQERLFITSERQHLQALNEKVCKTVERLFHLAWIAKQQRINLEGLILSRPDCSPSLCCQRANILEATTFQDAYKQLGFHEPLYGDFLQQFRANPKLIAMCLVCGESMKIELMHQMVNVVMASIFGHCIFQEDEKNALLLLKHLMELQLATSENPRRLLRHGSCAFSRVYKSFNEGLFSAKLFLTAALHDPVMHLLMEDELFLDIDPGKAVIRFPAQERLRRFGQEGTPEYKANLQKYRLWTITKLVNLTNRFIFSIKNNMHCLPPSLIWLVKQLYNMLMKAKKVEVREVGAMCADLVFYFFICEAIVNPEPYGIISDTPISYIARFNLMQVAQILHVLAMSKWEEIDQKLMDLYGRFEKDCMSSLLDSMLEGAVDDTPPDSASQLHGLARTAVLISESDLMVLINFLRSICAESSEDQVDKKMLERMLSSLPPIHPSGNVLSSPGSFTSGNSTSQTPPQTPSSKRTILSKVGKKNNKTSLHSPLQDHSDDHRKMECEDNSPQPFAEEILIISLNNAVNECPGMLPEHKVLSMEQQKPGRVRMKLDSLPNEEESIVSGGEIQEKRTRFSLSHDQDSIGTSDNLEAISEAASNHSVASSLELENENENDNLSDMVSANVSGRGTPNVSGRDTPSSQIEGEEREQRPLDLPVTASKQNPEDIDDKFGKFEFKPLMEGDEAVSMVSDTWSTDVLASDSEMVEQSDQNLPERPLDDIDIPGQGFLDPQQPLFGLQQQNIPDIADTASEAWSTDVMASDSERLQDLDTDDTGSVARSDDTASVARSDDTARSEVDGDIHPDHLQINILDHGGDDNITPRASGSRSPIDEIILKPHHHGDLLRPCPLVMIGNQSTPQTYNFQPIRESSDAFKIPEIPEVELRPKNIPVPLRNHSSVEETKASHTVKSTRTSENQQSFNKSSMLLQTFDPLAPTKLISSSPDRSATVAEQELNSERSYSLLASGDTNGHCEVMGMQTLGRLSLTLGELPDNGSLSTDNCVFAAAALSNHSAIDSDVDFLPLNSHSHQETEDKEERASVSILSDAVENSLTVDGDEKEKSAPGDDLVLLDSVEKEKGREEKEVRLNVRLSSASLISSSSSSSSSGSGPVHNDIASSQETTVSNTSGAIPKSISFDKTAERGDKEVFDSEDPKHKKSFFKGFKFAFKGRNRKSSRSQEDGSSRIFEKGGSSEIYREEKHITHRNLRRAISEDTKTGHQETSDIILEKYRKKPSSMIETSVSNPEHLSVDKESVGSGGGGNIEDDRQLIDPSNPESSFAFTDAKRKLRLVLSAADFQTLPWMGAVPFSVRNGGSDTDKNQDHELVAFLKMQLAEAVNLQDRSLIAQLHETLRCVHLFDKDGCKKLFRSLREDYKKRAPYIAYLVRCRQGLLSTLAHLERILNRIERDKIVCNKYMISMCVRFFLQQRDAIVKHFVEEFQKLTASDEKTDLVEQFLQQLYREMETDFIWQAASEEQTDQAQVSIERSIMSQMYIHAMYPNGDGDVMRDKLFYEHIQKLSKVLTPNHKYLSIAKMYHYECPWPAAQAEIVTINAYKTPRDKLQCVLHCCNTIMNLLRLANEKSIPAADDFMPVLVYVLVKANPPNLLSSIQYVNSFYHKCIQGEEEYWWTQFCAAIEFIKTLEYDE